MGTSRSYRARNAAYARWHREPVLTAEQEQRLTEKAQTNRHILPTPEPRDWREIREENRSRIAAEKEARGE